MHTPKGTTVRHELSHDGLYNYSCTGCTWAYTHVGWGEPNVMAALKFDWSHPGLKEQDESPLYDQAVTDERVLYAVEEAVSARTYRLHVAIDGGNGKLLDDVVEPIVKEIAERLKDRQLRGSVILDRTMLSEIATAYSVPEPEAP